MIDPENKGFTKVDPDNKGLSKLDPENKGVKAFSWFAVERGSLAFALTALAGPNRRPLCQKFKKTRLILKIKDLAKLILIKKDLAALILKTKDLALKSDDLPCFFPFVAPYFYCSEAAGSQMHRNRAASCLD